MKPAPQPPSPLNEIEQTAALWVLRRDRGLTATEQDELSQWLAADARHGETLAASRWGWDELDRLTGLQTSLHAVADPDLLAPGKAAKAPARWLRPRVWLPLSLAAAAALVFGLSLREPAPPSLPPLANERVPTPLTAPCERLVLDDGSVVELNRGAQVTAAFSTGERRVRLNRGEASFVVAKDSSRPFVVSAGRFEVRAVGTVFNVEVHGAGVDVVVTEGRVSLQPANATKPLAAPTTLLAAGQLGELRSASPEPRVNTLTPGELETRLAWQPRLLDFTDAALPEILLEFNRRNPVKLLIADAPLAALRLSASFRSDNVEGFLRLMESDFAMRIERRNATEIALWRR